MSGPAIRHTVVFRLPHAAGSPDETVFLDAARTALIPIPGVEDFVIRRQVSPKSDLTLQFAMTFADRSVYAAYDAHPHHVAFVATWWVPQVEAFQEYDLVVL